MNFTKQSTLLKAKVGMVYSAFSEENVNNNNNKYLLFTTCTGIVLIAFHKLTQFMLTMTCQACKTSIWEYEEADISTSLITSPRSWSQQAFPTRWFDCMTAKGHLIPTATVKLQDTKFLVIIYVFFSSVA